jgi:hypothetical protein
MNFGQDSTFSGGDTSGAGASDGGGIGDFYYAPPSGFLALCASNLAEAAVTPSEQFKTVLWAGTSQSHAITGVGFQPDWVWIKHRDHTTAHQHNLFDVVRGVNKTLHTNSTEAEESLSDNLNSFDADGFTVGDADALNDTNFNYVGWNWNADTAFTNDASSTSVGSADSAGRVNAAAGFSIIGYTGTSGPDTIAHGLSKAPEMFIVKSRSSAQEWLVYHEDNTAAPETDYLRLDTTAATADNTFWNDTLPTATVFSVGDSRPANSSHGDNYITYCFHSVYGYSTIGSWIGNANDVAPFTYTGFRPAWIMWKKATGAENWFIVDTTRSPHNKANKQLWANATQIEETSAGGASELHILSNGFKPTGAGGAMNGNNETYVFMAFAERPFKYSNAR